MTWTLIEKPKTVCITRELAKQFCNMEAAPNDRPLSEMRLRVYEKVAIEGGFRPVDWASAYCVETGQTYRVNGKHTSTLFSNLTPLPELYAVMQVFKCETLSDVAKLYSTFDSRMQSRTVADINHSFAACVPQLSDIDPRTINTSVPAIWYSRHQENYKRIQPAERAEVLLEHWNFVTWVFGLLGRSNGKHGYLKRMPVFAAMFATYQKHPKLATDFWTEVRDETGVRPELPTRKLARFLSHQKMIGSERHRSQRHLVPEREFFVKCLHAWNAYRNNETTNLNYFPKAEVPQVK